MIVALTLLAAVLVQGQGYDVWGTPGQTAGATPPLKDRDSYIVAAGKATSGLGPELQRLKDAGKVLDPSKTLMPAVVPIADEINYINDGVRQKLNGDRMTAVNQSLTYLIANSDQPSFTGIQNPFVKHTKAPFTEFGGVRVSRELGLALRVAQSGGNLDPADLMGMSLEACKGDLQSALLTSHNFLKELGYASRANAAGPAMFAQVPGDARDRITAKAEASKLEKAIGNGFRVFATRKDDGTYSYDVVVIDSNPLIGKLQNLRPPNDPVTDKMGPWYHSFVGLVIGSVSTGGDMTAATWAKLEGLMRNLSIFRLFSSPPDYFKELITERMAMESGTLMGIMATSIKVTPARSEIEQGSSQTLSVETKAPRVRSEVWYKWSFGGEPVWLREPGITLDFAKPGEFTITVELYDNTKLARLAKATAIVRVKEVKAVAGSWNLVSATIVEEGGFKDQNRASTGGNNSWSGDPRSGRIYRSWGWGFEGEPFVSPLKFEAMHTWEIPKTLKPGSTAKIRLSITDVKYNKLDPNPQSRGYTMSTGLQFAIGFLPDLGGSVGIGKAVFDGSKDMLSPEPVEQTFDVKVPAAKPGKDLVIRIRVANSGPYIVFDLTYKMK